MNFPVEYLIGVGVLLTAIVITFTLTKRRYQSPKKPMLRSTVTTASVVPAVTQSVTTVPTNSWKLEVNGEAKFDIKVEWSDGDVMKFSGQAPEVYTMVQEKGVLPINTAGIAPEWADDGISYQWYLNGHHWC